VEGETVIRRLLFAILELGLGDRGAEVDVPQRRRERLIRLAALEVAQERELARADGVVRDRAVRLRPVDRSPSWRKTASNAFSSSSVSSSHSSMKLRRLMGT
jgi:hypothetical protein